MVEPLLYAALGFLTASLVALFMGRALWNRAVRLTTHRIMRRLPLSRDEIVASRDLLRAEVAIEHRRLERQANIMRNRMTQSMADVGRRDATIVAIRGAVEEAKAKVVDAETRTAAARKTIDQLKSEAAAYKARLSKAESGLTEKQRLQKAQENEQAELIKLADDRRAAVAAAASEVAQLKLAIGGLEDKLAASRAELKETQGRLVLAQTEKEGAERQISNGSEDVTMLRQQIERLASDIARVAGSQAAPRSSGGGGGALHSAARASRDADPVGATPVTFPPVR